jgi:hypothetical protein
MVLSCLLAVAGSLMFPGVAPPWIAVPFLLLLVLSGGLFTAAALAQIWTWIAPSAHRSVAIEADGLTIVGPLGGRLVKRSELAGGWVQRSSRGFEVALRTKRGNVLNLAVGSEPEGEAVLDALGVHPDKRALEMPLGSALRSILGAITSFVPASCAGTIGALTFESLFKLPSATTGLLIFALTALSMIAIAKVTAAPVIEVGVDGVSVSRPFSSDFIPFSKIQRAAVNGNVIDVALVDGRNRAIASMAERAVLDAIVERINQGATRARLRASPTARLAMLDREGRDFSAWLEHLKTLAVARDDYRYVTLTREELSAVLDDALASPERRIAAAYVLAQLDRGSVTERVRVVVEKSANDAVCRALERAAEGTLDEQAYAEATRDYVRVGA